MQRIVKFKIWIIFVLIIGQSWSVSGQNSAYKALYIYNFTKLIDWPQDSLMPDFIIGIYNNEDVADQLKQITINKSVGNRKIVIKELKKGDIVEDCELIYFSGRRQDWVNESIKEIEDLPILIITDKRKTEQGINFIETETALNFEIYPKRIKEKGLSISNSLLNLGIVR